MQKKPLRDALRSHVPAQQDAVETDRGADSTISATVAVFATTAILTYAAMTALFPSAMAPVVAAALDIPAAAVGLQISLVYMGAIAGSLIGGTLTRRTGACRATQIALILMASGAALASAPTVSTFVAASLLIGVGYGLTNPAASHLLARFVPAKRRALIFSIKQTGVPLGGVLAGALAPTLAVVAGWQFAMLSLVLLAGVAGVLLQQQRKTWDHDRNIQVPWRGSFRTDVRLVWESKPLRYLSLAGLCFAAVQLSVSAFTVTLLVEEVQIGMVQAGFVMAAMQGAGVAGRIIWGWIADTVRSGVRALVSATLLTMVATVFAAQVSPAWPTFMIVAIFCLLGFCALGWNGVYLARVAELAPPGNVARASGGSLFFTFIGVLLGPPAFAGVQMLTGSYTIGFYGLAGIAAVGMFLLLFGEPGRGR